MTVLVTGGTGNLGRRIIDVLVAQGRQVQVVTRSPYRASQLFGTAVGVVEWHPLTEKFPADQCQRATHILHLMGAPLNDNLVEGTPAYASHVAATQKISDVTPRSVTRLVAASSTRIYPTDTDGQIDETRPLGEPQSPVQSLLQNKEKAVYSLALRQPAPVSVAAVRLANVVDPSVHLGGISGQLADIASGAETNINIVGINDVVRLFLWLLDRSHVQGPVNAVSPEPAQQNALQAIVAANTKDITMSTQASRSGIWGNLTGGLKPRRRWSATLDTPMIIPKLAVQNGFKFNAANAADLIARVCPNPAVNQTPDLPGFDTPEIAKPAE